MIGSDVLPTISVTLSTNFIDAFPLSDPDIVYVYITLFSEISVSTLPPNPAVSPNFISNGFSIVFEIVSSYVASTIIFPFSCFTE